MLSWPSCHPRKAPACQAQPPPPLLLLLPLLLVLPLLLLPPFACAKKTGARWVLLPSTAACEDGANDGPTTTRPPRGRLLLFASTHPSLAEVGCCA